MTGLTLKLLGPIHVEREGKVIHGFRSQKTLALLGYLAAEQRPVARTYLAGLFWADMATAKRRGELRRALHNLSRHLPNCFQSDRRVIRFETGTACRVDLVMFDTFEAQGDLTGLIAAADLYRGEFMEDIYLNDCLDFETWLLAERVRWRQKITQVLRKLIIYHANRGDYESGLHFATRLLTFEPWQEEAHRHVMLLLARSGQRSASLAQYEVCCQILDDELGVEPAPETLMLYQRIRAGELGPKTEGSLRQQDWDEAPGGGVFYDRQAELAELEQWLVTDQCRLVTILGMGGQGKTALAAKLAQSLVEPSDREYIDRLIWRSLLNAPPLDNILREIVQFLSDQQVTVLPPSLDERLALVVDYLRKQRCLLILDNLESILQGGGWAGYYRAGYEDYGQLMQRVGAGDHKSCLLLTSRERPRGLARLERSSSVVRSFQLAGLPTEAGQEFLRGRGLSSPDEATTTLVQRYSGNPLALNLVSDTIQDLFDGDVSYFLAEETPIFDDIREVLDQQFARLSALERDILTWLAIEREAVSIQLLADNLIRREPRRALLEALRSLQRRSLVEMGAAGSQVGFTLQNVVLEYVTDHLIEAVYQEIETFSNRMVEEGSPRPSDPPAPLLNAFTLLKAQAKDYVRESQARLIIQPLVERLLARLGRKGLEETLRRILAALRTVAPTAPGYAGGNILNLLIQLDIDLQGYDFSRLTIWQAYLQGVSLIKVSFAEANLAQSVFTDRFGSISSVAISPNGQLLAAGTGDGEIRLWQIDSRQPYQIFEEYSGPFWCVAFSPDSQTLASGGRDQTIRLWDVRTGQVCHTLQGHTKGVGSVAFSPDGHTLASGSSDHTIRLWDVRTGQSGHILHGHTNSVTAVAFSPDGQTLVSGSYDQTVRLWDVRTGQSHLTLHGHTNWIMAVAFSPDGQTLASASNDKTIHLWDIHIGQSYGILRGHTNGVMAVAFSSDGQTLASGSSDQTIRVWDTRTGQIRHTLHGHTNWVRSIAFGPDSETLASGSYDQTIRVWDVRTGQSHHTLQGYTNWVESVAFSPDGHTLASGSSDHTIRLWDVRTGQSGHILHGHTNSVTAVAFSPDGQTLVSGSYDQTVRLWDVRTGQSHLTLHGHTNWIMAVAFSPDGQTLVSASVDHTIRLWDIRTRQSRHTLHGHTNWVRSVAFSPDGQTLASGSFDQTIRLWNVHTGQSYATLHGHTHWVAAVAFSPDGQILTSGSDDQTIRLWDVRTGQSRHTLYGHSDAIRTVAFSPDGRTVASGSVDHTIRLWDVRTGQLRGTLHGHTNTVRSVAFNPDDETLVSGSVDETIRLWDIQTGKCLKMLRADGPYAGMNITRATGLTATQKEVLKALGAVDGNR